MRSLALIFILAILSILAVGCSSGADSDPFTGQWVFSDGTCSGSFSLDMSTRSGSGSWGTERASVVSVEWLGAGQLKFNLNYANDKGIAPLVIQANFSGGFEGTLMGRGYTSVPIKGHRQLPRESAQSAVPCQEPPQQPMTYHGGPLITGDAVVYHIWYGDWSQRTEPALVAKAIANIGSSSYTATLATMWDQSMQSPSGVVLDGGGVFVPASPRELSAQDIESIVLDTITVKKLLPLSGSAIYVVHTSKGFTQGGFCKYYCGWHYFRAVSRQLSIKYAFIGDPAGCTSCMSYENPSGSYTLDGIINSTAHEVLEAVSDPELTGWWGERGETMDACLNHGTEVVFSTPDGSGATVQINGAYYDLQAAWSNLQGGRCSYVP